MNKVYHGFSHSSGVYKITNKENGIVYFGQAVQLGTRAMQHEKALVKNKHDNRHLQFAWNKYGPDAFEFEVIAVYPDKTERDAAEQALIDEHYGPGCYNLQPKVAPERTTWSHTPAETSAKISAAKQGKKLSPEHCAAIGAAMKGKKLPPRSPEYCAAQSAAQKGKKRGPRSPEHCASIKAAWAKRRAAKNHPITYPWA